LLGNVDETEDYKDDDYIVGSEALDLILAFNKTKPINKGAHSIQVIKNFDLETKALSHKKANIFFETKGIHSGLFEQLREDLPTGDSKFEKTYLVEIEGTTGHDHVVSVTIRKNENENTPLIEIFSSSPALVRFNLGTSETGTAEGGGILMVAATLQAAFKARNKKATAGNPLTIDDSKFYSNTTPFQMKGHGYCGTFALESALENARQTRGERETYLKTVYKDKSPYGGMTEIKIDLSRIKGDGGKVQSPLFALQTPLTAMSHFDSQHKNHKPFLESKTHPRKSGTETFEERRERYLRSVGKDDEPIPAGSQSQYNAAVKQKSLRHKVHLFETIRGLARGAEIGKSARSSTKYDEMLRDVLSKNVGEKSQYDHDTTETRDEAPKELKSKIESVKTTFESYPAIFIKAEDCGDGKNMDVTFVCGGFVADKMRGWATDKDAKITETKIPFSAENGFDFGGLVVDESLCGRREIKIKLPTGMDELKEFLLDKRSAESEAATESQAKNHLQQRRLQALSWQKRENPLLHWARHKSQDENASKTLKKPRKNFKRLSQNLLFSNFTHRLSY
jgi:hypothetical protein